MSDCIFCKIAAGELPADIVHQDEHVLAFRDLNPQAPTHILVIPRRHLSSLDAVDDEGTELMGRLVQTCRLLARKEGVAQGYRVVNNCGAEAGQSVFHLHFHLLGGRAMAWPPG